MHKTPTIEQMNEAIALFMGGSSIKEHGGKRYVYYPKSCARDVAELQYYSDWNRLMPVFHAIREKAFALNDEKASKLLAKLNAQLLFGTIADVHLHAFRFIEYVNKQSTTTNDTTTRNK
jgi:hypothetical protein